MSSTADKNASAVSIFQGLSLFRILYGLLLLYDYFVNLAPFFGDFYSEAGFLPRAVNAVTMVGAKYLSILQWCDAPWQLALFQIVYVAALICFTLGYRTVIAKMLVFVGFASLYWRNPIITAGADMLIRVFLVWGLFVPLARYWSMDAALNRAPRDEAAPKIFITGIKLQICMLYLFGALFKLAGKPWLDGIAPALAVHDGAHGSPLGSALADAFPFMIPALSYGIILFQVFFSALVYSPVYNTLTRNFAILGAALMHGSFIFFLRVGIFPYACLFYLPLLVPDSWFNAVLSKRRARLEKMTLYYDPDCGFCEKMGLLLREFCLAPASPVLPASADPTVLALLRRHNSWILKDAHTGKTLMKWEGVAFVLRQNPFTWIFGALTDLPFVKTLMQGFYTLIGQSRPALGKLTAVFLPFSEKHFRAPPLVEGLCGFMIVMAFLANVVQLPSFDRSSGVLGLLNRAALFLQISQRWDLFAPIPPSWVYDYRATGVTFQGQAVDLTPAFERGVMSKLDAWHMDFQSHHWMKYFVKLYEDRNQRILTPTLQNLCAAWNAGHESDRLKEATLVLLSTPQKQVKEGKPLEEKVHETLACP